MFDYSLRQTCAKQHLEVILW